MALSQTQASRVPLVNEKEFFLSWYVDVKGKIYLDALAFIPTQGYIYEW